MPELSIFIGVVSYAGTRFGISQGDRGLGASLVRALADRGVRAEVVVDIQDRWDGTPVTPEEIQEALTAQARLEDAWVDYLNSEGSWSMRERGASVLRWFRRGYRRIAAPDEQFVVRLINIELAHRELWQRGFESGAEWILIIEDDASSTDVADLADGLVDLLESADSSVQFINLSESFSLEELGVKDLLLPDRATWKGSSQRSVFLGERPVTNTVCAIAYRSAFAVELLRMFSQMPLHPVVPIDWKLNQALMKMFEDKKLSAGSCLWVVPGPIDQLSMRST